jgi:hypothetical protein
MKREIEVYKLASSDSPNILSEIVNSYIGIGYELKGKWKVLNVPDNPNNSTTGRFYYQLLVKYAEPRNDDSTS